MRLSKKGKIIDLLIGADACIFEIIPDENNFVDFSWSIAQRNTSLKGGSFDSIVYIQKFGGIAQVTKPFIEAKLKLFGALRYG